MRLALAAAALAMSSTPARAQFAEPGVYTEACLPSITCSVAIEKVGNAYRMTWTVTDRTGRVEYCRYSAWLAVCTGTHRDERIPGVLVGTLFGTNYQLMIMPTGDHGQVWLYLDANVCPKVRLPAGQGVIGMNGFYDLEGDL